MGKFSRSLRPGSSHRSDAWLRQTQARQYLTGASPLVLGALLGAIYPNAVRAQAVNLDPSTNNILADGRTQTRIATSGSDTRITTGTVSQGVGFNSFSDFEQAAGTRVDLYVPDNAGSLVNIVRNGAVVINGELNGIKDGAIGGNIFFSSSNGFIVGANGRINVGSLTVNTPTDDFLDRVVGADGRVNQAVADQLMRGEVPVSENGTIAVLGKVNAQGGISLQGHSVTVNGRTGPVTGSDLGQRVQFDATVNSTGLVEGGALVSQGGRIVIAATGGSRIAGRLDASSSGGKGGSISVTGGDIAVDRSASLSADGSAGGEIVVFAGGALVVQDGASFSAAGPGGGGFLELSGKSVTLGSLAINLSGGGGRFLIDPEDLVITAGSSIRTPGVAITLQATRSITLDTGGTLDSRSLSGGVSTGNSGAITVEAPSITLRNGAAILAGVSAGSAFGAGNVTLTAAQPTGGDASITLGVGAGAAPVLSGRDITLTASASDAIDSVLVTLPTARASITATSADITATGKFTATASAEIGSGLSLLPIGVIVSDASAIVDLKGTTSLRAGSVTLGATSAVDVRIKTESLAPANSAADGAVAVSTITSTAIARVGGSAQLDVAGATTISAENTVAADLSAIPNVSAFGASVGVSVLTATTTAELADAARVTTGDLLLDAQTDAEVAVTAKAGAGGATEPSVGSRAATVLAEYGGFASNGGSQVSVAGAIAVSKLDSATAARIATSAVTTASGDVSLASGSAAAADLVADGTAVESNVGVGVAVGVNIARVSNEATIASRVSAANLSLAARKRGDGARLSTSATSGAGAKSVGIAGSFAVNLLDTSARAVLAGSAVVTVAAGGAVSLTAENASDSTAEATPAEGGATGDTVGIGASIALNILANRTLAEVSDGAGLSGAQDVTLAAIAEHSATTKAEAGSAGGISLTPALGLSMVNNATTARIGTGGTLTTTGLISVSAAQSATTSTEASGEAAGSTAAVGAALALALIDDRVTATTARNITAGGDVRFAAAGASLSTLTAKASAVGAAPAEEDGAAPDGGDVDGTVTDSLSSGAEKQKAADVGDADQQAATDSGVANEEGRSASTSQGKVSVAAAVGVNVQTASVTAFVPDSVSVTAGGTLRLASSNNTDGQIEATGDAVGQEDEDGNLPPQSMVGIGAAVSVNLVKADNTARLGANAHSLGGLEITADKRDVAKLIADPVSTDTRSDTFVARATSGAGGGNVGIAGSLALNLLDTQSQALVASGATVTLTAGGSVALTAENLTDTTAEALPTGGGATGGDVGIGASIALNILANRTLAEVSDGAALSGAQDVTLAATAEHSATTKAEAGSAGGISLTPALGLSMVNNATTARIGTGGTLTTTGLISVSAAQSATTSTEASGEAAGSTAAVGAALALALIDDRVTATTARNLDAGGDVSFAAKGGSSSTLTATASAAGAAPAEEEDSTDSGNTTDKAATEEFTAGAEKQKKAGVGDAAQQDSTAATAADDKDRSAQTSEGKVSIAAAAAINVQTHSVTAFVPDAVTVTAAGALALTAEATTSGTAEADGQAVKSEEGDQSEVGIGAAVAVNAATETATATLGAATHGANGVTVSVAQADGADVFSASAVSGAGGSSVGIGGSVALNLLRFDNSALMRGTVDAGTGSVTIAAGSEVEASVSATPSDAGVVGGQVGVGASFAMNLVTLSTTARLDEGATLTNGSGLAITAESSLTTSAEAKAGAAGGIAIDASVALSLLDHSTIARAGTGNALTMGAGAVRIAATSSGTHSATSTGENKGGKVGVGASAAIILGNGAKAGALSNSSVTSATLARDVTAGSLSLEATADRTYDAHATATAGGGKEDKTNSQTGGTSTSSDSLEKTKDSQRDQNGEKGATITVAAAAGIAAAQDLVIARMEGVSATLSQDLAVSAENNVGMATSGIGAAKDPQSKVGIGVGVGLGILNNTTSATIGDGATIRAGAVSVTATTTENSAAPYRSKLTALGIAGSSGRNVSVAGALAVAISTGKAEARLGAGVDVVGTGAVNVTVDSLSHLSAKALAGSVSTNGVAVGGSIAVVYSEKQYAATIGAGSTIGGSALTVETRNHRIDEGLDFQIGGLGDIGAFSERLGGLASAKLLGNSNYYVEAIGGAGGSGASVQGSFAVMVFRDDLLSAIGNGTAVTVAGAASIDASADYVAKALSGALSASASSAGVGLSSTVIVSRGTTTSLLDADASVTASGFEATAKAVQDIRSYAASASAGSSAGVTGVAGVVTSENTVQALIGRGAQLTLGSGGAALSAQNQFKIFALAAGAGAGGTAGVGAAATVVTVKNVTRAALADGTATSAARITTTGAVNLGADATEEATLLAMAGAAGGTAGVGAGAGILILDTRTEALTGSYTSLAAGSLAIDASDDTSLSVISGALGGGGSVGAGAGVGVGVLTKSTKAEIGDRASVIATNVTVAAESNETVSSVTAGVGVGGNAGLAGAVTVFSATPTTTARIGKFASVSAAHYVVVSATGATRLDMIDGAFAAGTAGVGASVGVTLIDAKRIALIDEDASVTALGTGAAQDYVAGYTPSFAAYGSGDKGFSAPSYDPGATSNLTDSNAAQARSAGLDLLTKKRGATAVTQSARGVVVNAAGQIATRGLSVAGAAGAVGVSVSANVPVVTSTTDARIAARAQINTGPGAASTAQDVTVAAASDTYALGFSGSVAGGAVGVGAGVGVMVIDTTTRARIDAASTVNANGSLNVTARATGDLVGIAAAGSAGTVGVSGAVSVMVVKGRTEAALAGTATAQGNVGVIADDSTRTAVLAGALAVGLTGVGAAVNVVTIDKATGASIAGGADVTAFGLRGAAPLHLGGARGIAVRASSSQSGFTLAAAGAAGIGSVGGAGVISLYLLDGRTEAAIGDSAQINTRLGNAGADAAQDVQVVANDRVVTSAAAGGIAIGSLAGLAGVVDVGVFKTTTSASVGNSVTLNAKRDLRVTAEATRAGEAYVLGAGGGLVGLAAGIAVYSYGDGVAPGGEADDTIADASQSGSLSLGNLTSAAQDQARNGTVNAQLATSDRAEIRDVSQSVQDKRSAITLTSALAPASLPGGTSASIGSGTVVAGGAVAVTSGDTMTVKLTTGAAGGGAFAGGAGISVLTVDTGSTAQIDGAGGLTAGSVRVAADTDHSLSSDNSAGSAGLLAALSADFGLIRDTSRTTALLRGKTVATPGAVTVIGTANRTANVTSRGVALAGYAGIGASIAKVDIGGSVTATLANASLGSGGQRIASLSVNASATDSATATTTAAGGGVGAAIQGSVALASITPVVTSLVDAAQVIASGLASIGADFAGSVDSRATGIAGAGGLAVAASQAESSLGARVSATVSGASSIDADRLSVLSNAATTLARAFASGSSGALVGINATGAKTSNTASSTVIVSGASVTTTGATLVSATNTTAQEAEASGLAIGLIAAGFNTAQATSATTTRATLSNIAGLSAGTLTVSATGSDSNAAKTTAGSGGVVAGSAGSASTASVSVTEAGFLSLAPAASQATVNGGLTILAQHDTGFAGSVDTTQASLVGASGASLAHSVTSTVNADIGAAVRLSARNANLTARNETTNDFRPGNANNVRSISGGLANVPSAGAAIVVAHTTNARVGAGALLRLTRPAVGPSAFVQEAYNKVGAHQIVSLDSGGAIALADAVIGMTVSANATASLGDGGRVVVDYGDIRIAAWGEADIDLRANATTYGLAGAPTGDVDIAYTGSNSVTLGADALLQATDGDTPTTGAEPRYATITIGAGGGPLGQAATLAFNATLDLFNKTAIPIFATPDPTVTVANSGTVTMGATGTPATPADQRGIRAAGDIRIGATRGTITANAVGTGKDIYREGLAKAASAISNLFGGGDVTFDYHGGSTSTEGGLSRVRIDGLVETGIQRSKTLILDNNCASGITCGTAASTGNIDFTISGPSPVGTDIVNRVNELTKLIADYATDPVAKAAYQNELKFLQVKLVALGLGTFDNAGNFVAGTFVGPSPKAALQADLAAISLDIDTLTLQFRNAVAANIVTGLTDVSSTLSSLYKDATFGLQASYNSAATQIRTLANFGADASYATTLTNIGGLVAQGIAAVDTIAARVGDLLAKRDANQGQVDTIATAQIALRNALLANNTTEATTQTNIITAAQTTISNNLADIAGLVTTIRTNVDVAQARATSVRDGLNTLIDTTIPSTPVTGTDAERQAATAKNTADAAIKTALRAPITGNDVQTAGALTRIASTKVSLDDNAVVIEGLLDGVQSATTVLRADTSTAGSLGGTNSLKQYIGLVNAKAQAFADKSRAIAAAPNTTGTPVAYRIDVADTAARLGNIFVTGDQLQTGGSGKLLAPGSAEILITNNTFHTLNLGNLILPDYDAGNLRFNGVLVYSAADITGLNRGDLASGFADPSIVTSRTSSRGQVEIRSTYAPEALPIAQRKIAPDIYLKTGAVIENTRGAVRVISEAGNIYIQGKINAGSVDILAKNGDFVASYVNGFNHIGGDPASFSNNTSTTEVGPGITANGAVSIAARYLNINSTIQSGIANWTLTLNSAPVLTASAAAIGVSQSAIDAALAANPAATTINVQNSRGQTVTISRAPLGIDAGELAAVIAQYNAEVRTNPNADPVRTLSVFGAQTQVNIKDYLSGQTSYSLQFTKAVAEDYAANAAGSDGLFSVVRSTATDNIGASYDAKAKQYVVNGTAVKGGFIQLFGQIMNTSSSTAVAKLNVLDGFGTININNSSNIPIVLRNLSTGEDATGTLRGVAGRIELTDVTGVNAADPRNPVISVKKTVFTRDYAPGDAQGTVKITTQTGTIDNATGNLILGGAVVTSGSDRATTYTPNGNQRYVWTTGESLRNTVNYSRTSTELFGSSSLTIASINDFNRDGDPVRLATYRLADGTYVTTDSTLTGGRILERNGMLFQDTDPRFAASLASNALLNSTQYAAGQVSTFDNDLANTGESSRRCNWWTLCIASEKTYYYRLTQDYTTITTNSLKANYPIGVNFIGSNTGSITVTSSNADVTLTNSLSAVAGSVSITAANGSIIQGDLAGEIAARSIALSAGGSVGGVTDPRNVAAPQQAAVAVRLTAANGALSANAADGNVSILSRGALVVDQVKAAGSVQSGKGQVTLYAFGALSGKDGTALVQGPRVSLTSVNGAVGSTTALLAVNTGFSTDPALRPFGDPDRIALDPNALLGLSVTAAGDIGIRSAGWSGNTDGNLLAVKVASTGGDVRLAATGQILDNNPVEGVDQRTYDQLLGYWESLGLLAEDAARGVDGSVNVAKQANLITAYENATTEAYRQYWAMRGTAAYDPAAVITVDPASVQGRALAAQFRAQAIAASAPDVDAYVAARIAEYQTAKTADYHRLNAQVGGLTVSFDAAYSYTATGEERSSLTRGAVWTERELAFSLAPGALKTVTGTNPVLKEPNVSGRSITIEAGRGIGETVGAGTANLGVQIRGNLDPRNLTLDQKVALASAERNDLQLTVGPVRLPGTATDAQRAAFDAARALGLDQDGVSTTLLLGADFATLTPRQQAALNAAALGLVSQADTLLTVLSKRPLNFNTEGTVTITVPNVTAANADVGAAFLASRGGALLGNISTFGDTRIKVFGDIANAATGSIQTGNLILEAARGSIGTATTPVVLRLRGTATTTARAQNGVNLGFPTGTGYIDTIFSPGDVKLTAQGALLNANNDDLINVLGATVRLVATTGSIGTPGRALNVGNGIDGSIHAEAATTLSLYGSAGSRFVIGLAKATGAIRIEGSGETEIDGTVENTAAIAILAGGRVVISDNGLVTTPVGAISIASASLKMLDGARITAPGNTVTVTTTGDALVSGIASGSGSTSAVSITAGGRIFSGKAPVTDISATASGAGVVLSAGTGIGDRTQPNLTAIENAVTDAPNPLRIDTGLLSATSTAGNIALTTLSETRIASLAATAGGIDVDARAKLTVTTASSGGDQRFIAAGALDFGTLTTTGPAASIEARSAATVTGGSATATGDITLGGTTVAFAALDAGADATATATAGTVSGTNVTAGGDIALTGIGVTIGSATADGDISLDGKTAAVSATTLVDAGGSATLTGTRVTFATAKTGEDLTATATTGTVTGTSATAGGDIALTGIGVSIGTASADGDISLDGKTAAVSVITLSDAGGASFITGHGVTFDTVRAAGDSTIHSTADIIGELEEAGETLTNIAGYGPGNSGRVDVRVMRAKTLDLQSTTTLDVGKVEVAQSITLRADEITAQDITQVPSGPQPLNLTVTGADGGTATLAVIGVDAPVLTVPLLRVSESRITTTAEIVDVQQAEMPIQGGSDMAGTMLLTTPQQTVFADARSITPKGNPESNLQLFTLGEPIALKLNGTSASTDGYVVAFDDTVQVTNVLGQPFEGISQTRDSVRNFPGIEDMPFVLGPFGSVAVEDEDDTAPNPDEQAVEIDGVLYRVFTTGTGPAVLIPQ